MNLQQFNKALIAELKRYPVFSKYWSEKLEVFIEEPIKLIYESSEFMGFYKKEFSIDLKPIVDDPLLRNTTAVFTLLFTSNRPEIDLERVTNLGNQEPGGRIDAANITLRVRSPGRYALVLMKKTLWSSDPAEVSGDPRYIKLLI